MLDLMKRGTVTVSSIAWEYHGDTVDPSCFYITPQPSWVMINDLPAVQIVEYQTSDALNGSGYCVLQVDLAIPADVVQAVTADIASRFGVTAPRFLMVPVQPGTLVSLTLPDGQGGVTGLQVGGTDFGSDGAIFQVPLTAAQLNTVRTTMGQQGSGPFEVQYSILVPAQMPAVTAALSFDADIAFNYQVTAHEHTHWASSSSWTYDITEQLTQSGASKVVVDKVDPNLPQSVVDAVANWGAQVIEDLVSKEVATALALQQGASGTQSFSVNEISSFTESYEQDETILWRLSPQSTLPTFGDLGLTPAQVQSLEVTVDKRQFVAQVIPQCLFSTSSQKATLGADLQSSSPPFLSGIKPLKHLDVTISYPTLASSTTRTHTFTDNTPYTWQADWDDTAQGDYSLSYMAVYDDDTQVTGSVNDVDGTTYTLGLADIGTLNVVFDASQFFTAAKQDVDKVTVEFSFNVPQETPYLESAVLTASAPQAVFSNVFPAPVTTDYVYTVTYGFTPALKANPYTSDAKVQNGPWVRLLAPDATQSFNVFVATEQGDLEITEADINFYYENDPYFPQIPASSALPRPTQSSPIQLKFPTRPAKSLVGPAAGPPVTSTEMQTFELFANTVVTPVTVTATLLLSDFSQLQVGPYQFAPSTVTLFAFSPCVQTVFLSADPTIVKWDDGDLTSVKVLVTAVRYTPCDATSPVTVQVKTPNQVVTQQPDGHAYPVFFVVANLPYDFADLEFDWTATYVYRTGALYTHGTQQGSLLSLPTSAADKTPAGDTAL